MHDQAISLLLDKLDGTKRRLRDYQASRLEVSERLQNTSRHEAETHAELLAIEAELLPLLIAERAARAA